MKSPIETLFIICDSAQRKSVLKMLTDNKMFGKVILNGKGTATSTIEDIFGFGIADKDVIISFVSCNISSNFCNKLNDLINKKTNKGIIFTTPVDAISSDLFQLIQGGKYES